ncbi:g9936 [Coccomyxa elongata]
MELLAAAEAPFSDPFLMEFEDPEAMQDAYGGNAVPPPPTFEQALMQARLEARQTAQAFQSVAMDGSSSLSQAVGNLLDAEPSADSSADSSPGLPVVRTPRGRSAADAEAPAEPAVQAPGANRFAGVRQLPPSAPVRNPDGVNVQVFGVVQQRPPSRQRSEPKCFFLAHNYDYANLSTPHYLAVKNTADKGACCSLCQRDSRCVAWTRVAGGRDDVRTCYLKDTFQRDPDLAAFTYSYAPPQLLHDFPQVRYIVETQPVILESGTKQAALPADLYGCPYPPVPGQPAGTCAASDTCNCHKGICYGSCKGGAISK